MHPNYQNHLLIILLLNQKRVKLLLRRVQHLAPKIDKSLPMLPNHQQLVQKVVRQNLHQSKIRVANLPINMNMYPQIQINQKLSRY